MTTGYKCPNCGEIVTTCDNESCAYINTKNPKAPEDNPRSLNDKFYCWNDGVSDYNLHFDTKKCIPKSYYKKVNAKGNWKA